MIRTVLAFMILGVGLAPGAVYSAGEESFEFFEEEAQVVTASRRLQPIQEAPVAIDVVTKEDIQTAGALHLWDLLRFRVGMDVIDGRASDGNRAIVSVRGFPQEYVNNLQVLVDGRSVYSASSGGVFWDQLPVQIQDIDRIEIVRGPNAALYGSNAGLGVINIITAKPAERSALSAAGLAGSRDTYAGRAAYEAARGSFGYRLSYSYLTEDGFPNQPDAAVPAGDFLTSNKANVRGFWNPSPSTRLELWAGGSWQTMGLAFERTGDFNQHFEMIKLTQDLNPVSSVELSVSRTELTQTIEGSSDALELRYRQYDVEALHHLNWLNGRLKTTWGGSYRESVAESDEVYAGDAVQKNPLWRGFVHQSAALSDRWTVVGAFSLEHSDTGDSQSAYQAAMLFTPVPNHTLRASYSYAPTIPTLYETSANQQTGFCCKNVGNPDIGPQKLQSYELGYMGVYLARRLQTEAVLFYMNVRDITASYVQSQTFFPFFSQTLSFDNLNRAIARGGELKSTYRFSPGRSVYANYTIETIMDDLDDPRITKSTPKHKVNLGASAVLAFGWSAALNAGYKSGYTMTSFNGNSEEVKAYWRLDARLAYAAGDRFEWFVLGKNLLKPRHREAADSLEVPRTFYGGLSVGF